jgi:hypothetical protein
MVNEMRSVGTTEGYGVSVGKKSWKKLTKKKFRLWLAEPVL